MNDFSNNGGKINRTFFQEVIQPNCGAVRPEVEKSPVFGVDTSVINLGDGQALAVSSDPLSLIPALGLKESAWLSVHLLANDIATTGFAPRFAQFVLNLPVDLTEKQFSRYWKYIHRFCDEIGVAVTGGHTAQVPQQESTVAGGGTMFLQAPSNKIVTADGAKAGDIIVVTKESALISSSILAKSFPQTVRNALGDELYDEACHNFWRTSSLSDGLTAADYLNPKTELTAMHDVTEGGLLGAIAEMAAASDCSFTVENEKLPVGPAPLCVTELFEIDHRFCTGAGSMVIAVKKGKEKKLVNHLNNQSIPAAAVGIMKPGNEVNIIVEGGDHPWRRE